MVKESRAVVKCPVCGEQDTKPVFKKNGLPYYVLERHYSRDDALNAKTGDVDFYFCPTCGFAFNRAFVPSLMNYIVDYESSRSHSRHFNNYLNSICEQINKVCSLTGKTVAEIGCGDGDLLMKLRKVAEFDGWGFEPSLSRVDKKPAYKDLKFIEDYYQSEVLPKKPDLIILRHILEHQGLVHKFLAGILSQQGRMPEQIYIEVPAWEWIVSHDQAYAFSYEHCSYFSQNSLKLIMAEHGYIAKKVSFVFENEYIQYFGIEEVSGKSSRVDDCEDRELLISRTQAFTARIPVILERLRTYFAKPADTVLWGAAGKGTTLLNLLDIDYKLMPYVVDSNSRRHNTYISVSGQQVVAPEFLKKIRPVCILITNSSYREEIEAQLACLGVDAEVKVIT